MSRPWNHSAEIQWSEVSTRRSVKVVNGHAIFAANWQYHKAIIGTRQNTCVSHAEFWHYGGRLAWPPLAMEANRYGGRRIFYSKNPN